MTTSWSKATFLFSLLAGAILGGLRVEKKKPNIAVNTGGNATHVGGVALVVGHNLAVPNDFLPKFPHVVPVRDSHLHRLSCNSQSPPSLRPHRFALTNAKIADRSCYQ